MSNKLVAFLFALAIAATASAEDQKKAEADKSAKKTPPAAESKTDKTPKIEITLDTSETPEMADWAAKAKNACEKSYPLILKFLGEKGFDPPTKTKIIFKKMNGVAHSAGGKIFCSAKWFTDHPDDVGAVIHELCHVVQGYHKNDPPSWVTEGIADYVRWFNFEPEKRHPHIGNPATAKYTDSYQTTAAFFDWIVKKKDPNFIQRMNSASRQGKYKPELFKEFAGKPLDELWAEFINAQEPKKKK